jgi:hypothetical protein
VRPVRAQGHRKGNPVSVEVGSELVRDYFRMFVNRRAYTLQSMRPHPETGRYYYYRPTAKGTGQPLSLTYETLKRHLEGHVTIALYAINPSTQCSKWVAIDADYKDALEDLLKLNYYLGRDHVHGALKKSRRGGHLWVFFATSQPRDAERTENHIVRQDARAVRGQLVPPSLEMANSIRHMLINRAIRQQSGPMTEVGRPASQNAVQPVSHFGPRGYVAGY